MAQADNSKVSIPVSVNRKTEILEAAVAVFAEYGYYRATTAQIAEAAGISQPYVYRFFDNKESLFLATLQMAVDRIIHSFDEVQAIQNELAEKLGMAYVRLMKEHPNEIALQVQAQVINEESVREAIRNHTRRIAAYIFNRFRDAGFPDPEGGMFDFMAYGMLSNVSTILDLPELNPKLRKSGQIHDLDS